MTLLQQRDEARRQRSLEVHAETRARLREALADLVPAGKSSCSGRLPNLECSTIVETWIDDEKGWQGALLTRLSIRIAGVRPALVPKELKLPLAELRGFRHVFVHAYDLVPEKLELLLKYGARWPIVCQLW